MQGPECPRHGDDALRLALGAIDGAEAARVERALSSCEVCAPWQRTALVLPGVAEGVAAGLEAFFAAERKGRRRTPASVRLVAALAATLVLVLGALALWRVAQTEWPGDERPRFAETTAREPRQVARPATDGGELQQGDAWLQSVTFHSEPQPQQQAQQTIFADRLESGNLGSWTVTN